MKNNMFRKGLILGIVILFVGASAVSNISGDIGDLSSGLVGYWSFDEGIGNIAHDSSGNGNDGTIHGATRVDGISGKALYFDGIDDYVDCGNDASLNFGSGNFSVVSWIKTNYSDDIVPISKYDEDISNVGWMLNLLGSSVEDIWFYVSDGSEEIEYIRSLTLNDDNWHQIVTVKTSTHVTVYFDGESLGSESISIGDTDNSVNLFIGLAEGFFTYFNGMIDEVRIYDRALSEEEIQDLYDISVIISVTIDIDPDTLNLESQGKWITCYIELQEDYDVSDIDVSSILLNDVVSAAENHSTNIGDYDDDGIPDLMVKFDRQAVQDILELGDNVAITVTTGEITDGTLFEGTDYIRVI